MARGRVSSLCRPIDIVRNMGKKLSPVAGFQILENIANLRQIRWHLRLFRFRGFFVNRWGEGELVGFGTHFHKIRITGQGGEYDVG